MGKEVLQSVKLKDVRRIITDKNHIILHYKVGDEITPVFEITREIVGRKAQFRIYSFMDIELALQEKYLKWYSNKANDFKDNSFIGDRKEIYARINFTKNVYLKFTEDDFIIDISEESRNIFDILKPININSLPYDQYYKTDYNSTQSRSIIWTEKLYMECIMAGLTHLGIKFIAANTTVTWYYLGYTMTTKIVSFGWLGQGTCYRPDTNINDKKIMAEYLGQRMNTWTDKTIFGPLNAINLFHNIGKYSDYTKLTDFDKLNFVTSTFTELEGGNAYYPDNCWKNEVDKKYYIDKGFKLFSDKPDFEKICFSLEIIFGKDIKQKLINLGYDKIIVGYFSYLDIYVHPVDHSSMSSWRYTNPFVLDLESGTVTYEVLKNNDVLPYPEAKIHEGKVLVTKNVPSSSRYGYILDLF